jgi:hypothetical protein
MRPIRIILPALLTAALLAGCGGGSDAKDRFSADYKPINDQLLQIRSLIVQAPQGTNEVLAGAFAGFATQLRTLQKRIDALRAPKELEPRVRVLSAAVGDEIRDLERVSHAAGAADAAGTRAGTQALVRDLKAADVARRALARKTGAKVGP